MWNYSTRFLIIIFWISKKKMKFFWRVSIFRNFALVFSWFNDVKITKLVEACEPEWVKSEN